MTKSRIPDRLDHMLQAAVQACAYLEGMAKEAFLADKRTQQAVVLNLILIGEEATKVLKEDDAFSSRFPQLPWRGMKGMRNRIAHGYFEINMEVVWETTQTSLPELIRHIPAIRASLP